MHSLSAIVLLTGSWLTGMLLGFQVGANAWPLRPPEAPMTVAQVAPASGEVGRDLPFDLTENVRKTVLDNGLIVLTKEVHTAPVVTVQVWYRIGSVDEAPGVNGIAHQLEHMLFKGTHDRPIQFGRLFSALGSRSNAFTSFDKTAYFNTVERDKLDALLVLEADRMQNALITPEALSTEQQVVISELQGYENSSGYRLSRAIFRAAFPNHPYGLPIGGTRADVEQFTPEQVRDYYQRYYSPDNAVLILVGDFDTETALNRVETLFGAIPAHTLPAHTAPATQTTPTQTTPTQATPTQADTTVSEAEASAAATLSDSTAGIAPGVQPETLETGMNSRDFPPTFPPQVPAPPEPIVVQDVGPVPLVRVLYPLPPLTHPDTPALHVMDYIIDNGGQSSRINQALVETGLASEAGSSPSSLAVGGWWSLQAAAAADQSLGAIDQALQQLVTDLQTQPIAPEELERAKANIRADQVLKQRDITSQAMELGDSEITTGDYRFGDRYLAAVAAVTIADVQRVAQTYLQPQNRIVGFFEPTQTLGNGFSGADLEATSESFTPGEPVDPKEVAAYLPPTAPGMNSESSRTPIPLPQSIHLPNGLQVFLLQDPSTPTVTLRGYVRAGKELDPPGQGGLAELTANNLLNGTRRQDKLSLAKTLDDRGIDLNFNTYRDGTYLDASSLKDDFPVVLQVLADVLQQATFPPDPLTLTQQRSLIALQQALDNPRYVAQQTLQEMIFPESHPFRIFPSIASLGDLQRSDLVQFYQTHYRPDQTVFALVGDFEPEAVRSQITQLFGSWQAQAPLTRPAFPEAPLPPEVIRFYQDLPGKSEAITYMGYPAINRQDPRYYAARVLNQILGGSTLSSRLGAEIRDRLGLTYGIYSGFAAGSQIGIFSISMQTAPENADQAIATTLALLDQVRREGVTAAEVETAKRSLASLYRVSLSDPDYFSRQILDNEMNGLSPQELRDFPHQLEAVTLEQVNQVARELLHPDQIAVVTVGPPLVGDR